MKRAKIFYSIIIVLCLVTIILSTYYSLGGFDPVEVYVMAGKGRTVIGNEYIEKYDYTTFDKRMKETRAAIDSGKLKGMLTVVFFKNESIGEDSIHYFMGASIDEIKDVLRLPAGYSYREFSTPKVFKIFMTQHTLVRPNPEEVARLMEVKAIEEGTLLKPYWFELYYQDESLSVEYWAK
ncbi:MAG: hypothetical protein RLN88_01575 [Ekhidna sp.]|uniref:hypothetical protein n=1 Tax=Ekhidna sp. TaxID=2608089 RepID=UPI0032EC1853